MIQRIEKKYLCMLRHFAVLHHQLRHIVAQLPSINLERQANFYHHKPWNKEPGKLSWILFTFWVLGILDSLLQKFVEVCGVGFQKQRALSVKAAVYLLDAKLMLILRFLSFQSKIIINLFKSFLRGYAYDLKSEGWEIIQKEVEDLLVLSRVKTLSDSLHLLWLIGLLFLFFVEDLPSNLDDPWHIFEIWVSFTVIHKLIDHQRLSWRSFSRSLFLNWLLFLLLLGLVLVFGGQIFFVLDSELFIVVV